MKTLLCGLMLICMAGVSMSADVRAKIEIYKGEIFSIEDCEYLKKIILNRSDQLNEMIIARRQGKIYEYDGSVWVETRDEKITAATLYKPDGSSVALKQNPGDTKFRFRTNPKDYFAIEDFAVDFPAGQYRMDVTFINSGIKSWYFTIPNYTTTQFPDIPDSSLSQDASGQLILNWSTVANANDGYDVWVDILGGKEVYAEDFNGSHPKTFNTPLGIKKDNNYSLGVSAYRTVGTSVSFNSYSNLLSFKKPWTPPQNGINKCAVSAGKDIGMGNISFSGTLDAMEADFLLADNAEDNEILIKLGSAIPGYAVELSFPITSQTLKKGIYTYSDKEKSFKVDTKTGIFTFSIKNRDLTGLCCPIPVKISFTEGSWWQLISNMITARDQFTGCVIDDKIYVFGGNGNPDQVNLKSGEVCDINTSTWSSIANNTHNDPHWGVEELAGVGLNGKFYVFGAWGGDGPSGNYGVINFNEVYDPLANTWTTLAQKPTITSASVPAVYDGKVYLFGGFYEYQDDNDNTLFSAVRSVVERYDPLANSWQTLTEMPKLLGNPAVAVYGDVAYIIGGYDYNARAMNKEVMVYQFASNTWTRNYCTAPAEAARAYSYASPTPVINGKAYLIGGIEGTLAKSWASNKFTTFDIAAKTWGYQKALPQATEGHLVVVHDETPYVIGGYEDDEDEYRTQSDVYALLPVDVGLPGKCYQAQFELDEEVVNSNKPCPLQFIQGIENSLDIIKYSFKEGKTDGTDSLTVSGTFTIAGDYKKAPLTITVGSQTFTVPVGQITSNDNSRILSCKTDSKQKPIVTSKLDYNKCTFTISIKNATISQSGEVPFGISCFDVNLEGFAKVNLN